MEDYTIQKNLTPGRTIQKNLTRGQLVLLGDSEDIFHKGAYRLGRIHRVHPQLRKGREIVRRATVAVLSEKSEAKGIN